MNQINIAGIDAVHIQKLSSTDINRQIVLFHGYGANQHDLAGLSQVLLNDKNMEWFFPNGIEPLGVAGMEMGRCWFDLQISSLQTALANNDYEYIEKKVFTKIIPALEKINAFFDEGTIDYGESIIGGFSQGSILSFATALNRSKKEKPKAICLFSPTFVNHRQLVEDIQCLADVPLFISHGEGDQVLPFNQTKKLVEVCEKYFKHFEFHSFSGGHTIPHSAIDRANKFLAKVTY